MNADRFMIALCDLRFTIPRARARAGWMKQMDDLAQNTTDMTPRRGFFRRVAGAMALGLGGFALDSSNAQPAAARPRIASAAKARGTALHPVRRGERMCSKGVDAGPSRATAAAARRSAMPAAAKSIAAITL
ncbi:MAG: hypothetical protein ACXU8R_27260, partial [Xanthobacteraceae bacterium]